jgi:hypothetical protein
MIDMDDRSTPVEQRQHVEAKKSTQAQAISTQLKDKERNSKQRQATSRGLIRILLVRELLCIVLYRFSQADHTIPSLYRAFDRTPIRQELSPKT